MNLDWAVYGYCALGVAVSIALPILLQILAILKDFSKPFKSADSFQQAPRIIAVSMVTGAVSLLVGLLLVALLDDSLKDWKTAVLFGYAWDSTLQRLRPAHTNGNGNGNGKGKRKINAEKIGRFLKPVIEDPS